MEEVTDMFRKEAKERNLTLLQAIKATPGRWAEMVVLLVLFLFTIPFYVTGHWWTLFFTPLLSWMFAANSMHDAMHFSVSTDWRINWVLSYFSPWTASPLLWLQQHVVGHHAYPNVAHKDPDIAHAPAVLRVHESVRWKPPHRFQMVTTALVWTVGAAFYLSLVSLKALSQGALNRSVFMSRRSTFRTFLHVLGRVLTACLLWVWPWFVFDWPKALVWSVVPILFHSLFFMVATQVNHLTPQNATASSEDYYVHQVVTSHSFESYYLCYLFVGGLNYQIEHHLFPTVNHCHLYKVRPIVKRLCEKHGVSYHESSGLMEALGKYYVHIKDMSLDPKKHK